MLCCPAGVPESPSEGDQSLPWFFPSAKCKFIKGEMSPQNDSVQRLLWQDPWVKGKSLECPERLHPLSALPPASSAFSRCQGSGILGREGLKWSSVSLSPCEVTKQNFISALSNWTTLITPVILFLPCVISLLGVKCLCAKFQSSWMPPLHRAAAPLSQGRQRSRLHKIINAWMW